MHHLTLHDLDSQLAEQLPARELMGRGFTLVAGNQFVGYQNQAVGSGNGSGNGNYSFLSALNGSGDGNLSGNFNGATQIGNISK